LSISCKLEGQTWTPTIRFDDDDYTIKNISYQYNHQTILLADSDVLGGGDCPIVRHNVTFDEVWLYNTSTFDSFTFFFGSHWGARDTPPVFADYQSSCAGFSNPAIRRGGSFVFKSEDIEEHEEQELASHCDEVFFRASEKLGSGGNQLQPHRGRIRQGA
jgi:hypothetical protein